MVNQRRSILQVSEHYTSDSDSSSDDEELNNMANDGTPEGYVKNANNVLVPIDSVSKADTARTQSPSPTSSNEEFGEDDYYDDDDSSLGLNRQHSRRSMCSRKSMSSKPESEGGWQDEDDFSDDEDEDHQLEEELYAEPRVVTASCSNTSTNNNKPLPSVLRTTQRSKSLDKEWKFDLEAMQKSDANPNKNAEEAMPKQIKAAAKEASRQNRAKSQPPPKKKDDDEFSFVSQEEAEEEEQETKPKKPKSPTTKKKKNALGQPMTPEEQARKQEKQAKREQEAAVHMEQRRKQRAERLAKAKARIAKEQQEKEQDEQEKAKVVDNSEEARRDRAHQFYLRLGMISREQLKRRIQKYSAGGNQTNDDLNLTEADIDLLPWNYNGSIVNASKMIKMTSSGMTRSTVH